MDGGLRPMPIISSVIGADRPQADGSRIVHEYHTWHDGVIQRVATKAAQGADANAAMLARVPYLEAAAIDAEKEGVFGALRDGAPPAAVVAKLRHNTAREVVKWAARAFFEMTDAVPAIRLAEYLRDNVPDAWLDTDIGLAARTVLRSRATAFIAAKTNVDGAIADTAEV